MTNGFHPDWWYAIFLLLGVLIGLLLRAAWAPR